MSSNSAPEFSTDVQTQFALTMNTNSSYTLPNFYDPEGNDVPMIYINSMENQKFPDFVSYDNSTKTIFFRPSKPAH